MEYFLLKPFEGGCKIKVINHDPDIFIYKMSVKGELPDFTLNPVPLISNRFKELLEQYATFMKFTPYVMEGEGKADFWAPEFKDLDISKARFLPDGTVEAVSYSGLLPIMRIPNYKKTSYIISLALAESLLRRCYVNLELKKLNCWEVS